MSEYSPPDEILSEQIYKFAHHKPIGSQVERCQQLRELGHALAIEILNETPPSREQSIALTKLEESIMWASQAIARNE